MIKKIYIILILSMLFVSCGKKNDPVFNKKQSKIFSTKIKVIV
tara:strand:+ start:88 stop:216 length:129 start_codon:yes stop_codon:yes gene_type:complete